MRGVSGLLALAPLLAPALARRTALPEGELGTPYAYISINLPENIPYSRLPFQLSVLESRSPCGSANVTLNGQVLPEGGSGSFTAHYGTVFSATWNFTCMEKEEQLMSLTVDTVAGISTKDLSITLRVQQVAPLRIHDLKGPASMTVFQGEPQDGASSSFESSTSSMANNLANHIDELDYLRSRVADLQRMIFMKERFLSDAYGWSESKGLGDCDSLKCVVGSLVSKLGGAAKSWYEGDFAELEGLFDDEHGHHGHHRRPPHGHGRHGWRKDGGGGRRKGWFTFASTEAEEHGGCRGNHTHGNHTHPPHPHPPPWRRPHHPPHHHFPPPPWCRCGPEHPPAPSPPPGNEPKPPHGKPTPGPPGHPGHHRPPHGEPTPGPPGHPGHHGPPGPPNPPFDGPDGPDGHPDFPPPPPPPPPHHHFPGDWPEKTVPATDVWSEPLETTHGDGHTGRPDHHPHGPPPHDGGPPHDGPLHHGGPPPPPPTPLRRGVLPLVAKMGISVVLVGCIVMLVHRRCCRSERRGRKLTWAERRAARKEACRRRRAERRAALARFAASVFGWPAAGPSDMGGDGDEEDEEEKVGMLSGGEGQEQQHQARQGDRGGHEGEMDNTMEDEIAGFRTAVDVVSEMVAAEEGRVRSLQMQRQRQQQHIHSPPANLHIPAPRHRHRHHHPLPLSSPTAAFADYMPAHGVGAEEEELPAYEAAGGASSSTTSDDASSVVADGFMYTPGSSSGYTPSNAGSADELGDTKN